MSKFNEKKSGLVRKKVDTISHVSASIPEKELEKKSDLATDIDTDANNLESLSLEYEKKYLKALEENYREMLESTKELEHCLNFIDKEDNEWKIRYVNQIGYNKSILAQNKLVEKTLENLKNRFKNQKGLIFVPKDGMEILNSEKRRVSEELADYKWRLEQEDKAYHAANDERKEILKQLNDARGTLNVVNMQVTNGTHPREMNGIHKGETFMTNFEDSVTSESKNTFSGKSERPLKQESKNLDESVITEYEYLLVNDKKQSNGKMTPRVSSKIETGSDLKLPKISP